MSRQLLRDCYNAKNPRRRKKASSSLRKLRTIAGRVVRELERRRKRHPFQRRAAIEPLIGHLKHDHRMKDNYLCGSSLPMVNAMLAAAAWNLKKLMRELADKHRRALLCLLGLRFMWRTDQYQMLLVVEKIHFVRSD